MLTRTMILATAAMLFAGHVFAQAPDPLPDPDLDLRVAGNVLAMARQPDGGVVFGGNFSAVNGQTRPSIARLDAAGNLDPDWNPGTNGTVSSLAVDASGAIYVGGNFTFIGGVSRGRIARLQGSGAAIVDPVWNPEADASVDAIALDGAGSVYIGGTFQSVSDVAQNRVARLPVAGNGSVVAAWSPGTNGAVSALQWSGGALYAGGAFTEVDGVPRTGLARISDSGIVDAAWTPGVNGSVAALLPDGTGRIYVGGSFTTVAGEPLARLARISTATGAVDTTWNPQADGAVSALMIRDSQLYVGGGFTAIGGSPRRSIARLSIEAGALADPAFDPSVDSSVRALAIIGDGTIAAGGLFTRVGDTLQLAMTRLSDTGVPIGVTDAESVGRVDSLLPLSNGEVVVGGYFQKADGLARGHLLKLRADGQIDPDWQPWSNAPVVAMARAPDGGVLIGGHFTFVNELPRAYLAKLESSGAGAVVPDWHPVASDRVLAMTTSPNAVFVGGEFNRIDGVERHRLARLAFDGTLDPAWSPTADAPVHALFSSATAVYAGGDFTMVDGNARNRLVRLAAGGEGVVDPAWNPGADARVSTLVADNQARVYAGGSFTAIAGTARPALARLTGATGVLDISWNPLIDDGFAVPGHVVRSLSLFGQALYVGGRFGAIGGLAHSNIARLSVVDASADSEWSPLADGNVFDIVVASSGRPVVGGDFIAINGTPWRSLVMFAGDDTIFADGFE